MREFEIFFFARNNKMADGPVFSLNRKCCFAKKTEGRAVIGDGAPFVTRRRSLGVQGWSQGAALNKR